VGEEGGVGGGAGIRVIKLGVDVCIEGVCAYRVVPGEVSWTEEGGRREVMGEVRTSKRRICSILIAIRKLYRLGGGTRRGSGDGQSARIRGRGGKWVRWGMRSCGLEFLG